MIFIGIYIGSYAVKAVAIKKVNKTVNIIQTHLFPIKVDAPNEQKHVLKIDYLKTLASLYKDQEVKYIFCLSQNTISTELLSFPFKERYKILKSLPFEMEEKLSLFDYTKMISDIKLINSSNDQNNILVFSSFKNNISDLLADIKAIGITPFIITCEASAIANLFETPLKDIKNITKAPPNINTKKNCQIYLKIGHIHTMAMVFYEGQLQNIYSFEWGVTSCIKQLAIKYEISFTKAMSQFYTKGFVLTYTKGYTGGQIEFAKIIQTEFENIIDKLRFLLLQIEGENIYTCKKMFICGGGAQIRNLQALLSQHLYIPVARAEHPVALPSWNLRHNDDQQNNLMTALGAAMEGFKKPNNPPINFLKDEFTIKFNPIAHWKTPLTLGISALILFSSYAILKNQQSQKLSHKMNTIFQTQSMKIIKIRRKQINIKKVQKFINSKKQLVQLVELNKILIQVPSALDKIKNLSLSIKKQPSWNLKINSLNITGNKIKIKGHIVSDHLKTLQKNLLSMTHAGHLQDLNIILKPTKTADTKTADTKTKIIKNNDPKNIKNNTVPFNYLFTQKSG